MNKDILQFNYNTNIETVPHLIETYMVSTF